jgi:hypothetical protein
MVIKRITGTRSYITVTLEDRSIDIQGELTLTPEFYADRSSINHWNEPYQDILISDTEKEELIKAILKFNTSQELKISFED